MSEAPDGRGPLFLADLPRFVFFTGKGGVGKTSLACAAAVRLAEAGSQVLLVSTDPASNVGQVFGRRIGNTITRIVDVPGLDAIEIDPQKAADAYREKIIGPVRDLLPVAEIESITEQLSGSCTTEIASFNEFTTLLADDELTAAYDHVLFDTAPTGHTIRLLQLPGEWTSFLDAGQGDASCLGPMAGLDQTHATYARAVSRLADLGLTRLVLVTRAQRSALAEAARTAAELADLGITGQHLVVNALLPADAESGAGEDPLAQALRFREQAALAAMPAALRVLPRTEVLLRAGTVVGLEAVRHLLDPAPMGPAQPGQPPAAPGAGPVTPELPGLGVLVDELAQADHGLVLCVGKGGVGKSSVAAALALALAERGETVHLSTTDPAAHLDQVLAGAADDHLTVSRIDPHAATTAYRERVLRTKGAGLDEAGRARLAEDLMSPCTEEVAVFGEFSKLVSQARRQFVVVDTAPTGHTLLLMDATGSYHRDVMRNATGAGGQITPLMRLQDPDLTKVVVVTLPDTTPVLEAEELDADLRRADIVPWAWVVNASLAAARPTSALLAARAAAEAPHLARVATLADRAAIIPMLATEPTGVEGLHSLLPATL
ncbi:arsenical pump-driving ATPase [Ornithinimicrobium panacihumi]|uniref:arsenical pump-driving ATPase n=1 Tax=Ornithinimicrobium panacihumi TaxID=2008449 RepID=UPI003F8941C5